MSHQQHVGEMLIAVYLGQRSMCVVLVIVTEASDQVGEHNLQISLAGKVLASVSLFEFLQNSRLILEVKEKVQVVVLTEIVATQYSELPCRVVWFTCVCGDIAMHVTRFWSAPPYCNCNQQTCCLNKLLSSHRTGDWGGRSLVSSV